MEILLGFLILLAGVWIGAIAATLLVGGVMGMEVPSWGGLIWRTGITALVALLGFLFIPGLWLWILPTAFVVAPLFRMEMPEDGFQMIGFIVVMALCGLLTLLIAGALLDLSRLIGTA